MDVDCLRVSMRYFREKSVPCDFRCDVIAISDFKQTIRDKVPTNLLQICIAPLLQIDFMSM